MWTHVNKMAQLEYKRHKARRDKLREHMVQRSYRPNPKVVMRQRVGKKNSRLHQKSI